jgi:mono/diheme cytochrome c family protein
MTLSRRSMWEVGERYARIHKALDHGNYALAQYHWDKIRATIQNGYLKRPGRRKNADAILLDAVWPAVAGKLDSGDAADAWDGFEQARAACMACHVAEAVGFMNDQPLFRALRAPDGD